jgi:hypothetical protein
MIGFAVVFSLPRISFFMTLVALINVVFTAIAVVTMVTAITMATAAVAVAVAITRLAKTGVAIIDSESAAASAACRTFLLDMIFS